MKQVLTIISIGIISITIHSCSRPSNYRDVELILLNKEVHYVDIDSFTINHVRKDYTELEKKLARNVITYRLVNNSKKNILFSIDNDELQDVLAYKYPEKEDASPFVCYVIADKQGRLRNTQYGSAHGTNFELFKYYDCRASLDSIAEINFKDLHPKADFNSYRNFIQHSFILHAGESKTFKVLLSLPIVQQGSNDNPFNALSRHVTIDKDTDYDFNLFFCQDSTEVKAGLEDYQLKELKDNDVSIFHGRLTSEKIELKVIK